jgi:ABC-type multidrug transport system fused ATPase/permease subunit
MSIHRLLFNELIKGLGWRFPGLIAWTVLVGLGESVSVVLLLPLLNRVGMAAATSEGANKLIDKGLAWIGTSATIEILAVFVAVATIQMALSLGLNWWTAALASRYRARRQTDLFSAFIRAKWSFLADKKAAEMTNAIVTECERLYRAFTISMVLLGNFVVALIYIVLSLLVAWQVTVSLLVFALLAALTMLRLYKKSYAVGRSIAPLNSGLQSLLNECFSGAKFIKASDSIERAVGQVEPIVRKLEQASAVATAMPGTARGILEYVALIGLAVILVLAIFGLGVAVGNVVIVLAMVGRLFPRLTTIQAQLHYLNANLHAVEVTDRLQASAALQAERRDRSSGPLKIARPTSLAVRGLEVKLGGRMLLDQVNLTLPIPGLLAIVGKSGAGKSTLAHALLGLVEPSAGSIEIGGHDLASTSLGSWRRAIGYVPQETILFHASIRDNLMFGNPAASAAEIEAAARRAHALDFINLLPDGFNTIIGDQGVKLSGGQRQRLSIVRALLMNPALLIMDEAMSALDTESEAGLLRTLEELRKQIGILLIAHRLAAARRADVICVFEAGHIVEAGSWSELMARKKRLYELAEGQSLAEDHAVEAV